METKISKSAYSYFESNVSKYADLNNLSLDQAALQLNRLMSDQNDSDYWKKRSEKDKELFLLSLLYWGVVLLAILGCAFYVWFLFYSL